MPVTYQITATTTHVQIADSDGTIQTIAPNSAELLLFGNKIQIKVKGNGHSSTTYTMAYADITVPAGATILDKYNALQTLFFLASGGGGGGGIAPGATVGATPYWNGSAWVENPDFLQTSEVAILYAPGSAIDPTDTDCAIIASTNCTLDPALTNTAIIAGNNITATQSNTLYTNALVTLDVQSGNANIGTLDAGVTTTTTLINTNATITEASIDRLSLPLVATLNAAGVIPVGTMFRLAPPANDTVFTLNNANIGQTVIVYVTTPFTCLIRTSSGRFNDGLFYHALNTGETAEFVNVSGQWIMRNRHINAILPYQRQVITNTFVSASTTDLVTSTAGGGSAVDNTQAGEATTVSIIRLASGNASNARSFANVRANILNNLNSFTSVRFSARFRTDVLSSPTLDSFYFLGLSEGGTTFLNPNMLGLVYDRNNALGLGTGDSWQFLARNNSTNTLLTASLPQDTAWHTVAFHWYRLTDFGASVTDCFIDGVNVGFLPGANPLPSPTFYTWGGKNSKNTANFATTTGLRIDGWTLETV